jgi:peptide deformylase
MAIRDILMYAQHKEELRRVSTPVTGFGRGTRRLIRDLKDTLEASSDGVGLAAPQIGAHQSVVVVCVGEEVDGEWQAGPPTALVNPVIVEESDARKDFDGCLSFPGLYGETVRPHHLRVSGLDEAGQPFERVFEGFNAVVVHHEIDHLEGVLFIDRIENWEELYTLVKNEQGEVVRAPITFERPARG